MLEVNKKNIQNWANKLMFRLDEDQVETLESEFDVILDWMKYIGEIKGIEEVEPMTFPYKVDPVVLRDDDFEESEDIDNLLSNAKEIEGREIKVPKVVEE